MSCTAPDMVLQTEKIIRPLPPWACLGHMLSGPNNYFREKMEPRFFGIPVKLLAMENTCMGAGNDTSTASNSDTLGNTIHGCVGRGAALCGPGTSNWTVQGESPVSQIYMSVLSDNYDISLDLECFTHARNV